MVNAVYEKLVPALNARGTILPSIACDEYFAFVSCLFTPEEAEILAAMPMGFATAEEIAGRLPGSDATSVGKHLEEMCDKGLIHSRKQNGKHAYEVLPFVPGICELQFLTEELDERHKKIAFLLDAYNAALKKMFMAAAPAGAKPSFPGRKLVVEQDIFDRTTIIPYHEAKELIMESNYISAGICNCRRQGVLKDRACNNPLDNCMIFGKSAEFTVERGFTKKITREEALKKLDQAEEAGLIHQYCNSPERFTNLLCHCCDCHCLLLRGAKRSPVPSQAVVARYLLNIDDEACITCEACIERCQMKALKIEGAKLVRDEMRCVGCGVCMYVCPTEALSLDVRLAGRVPLKKC